MIEEAEAKERYQLHGFRSSIDGVIGIVEGLHSGIALPLIFGPPDFVALALSGETIASYGFDRALDLVRIMDSIRGERKLLTA